jgi:hypothetical protein
MSDPDRPDMLTDLTRWNRAGLSRFTYVDGDAASWLEELRIATMGLVARGAAIDERVPETWRWRFSLDPAEWPDPAQRDAFVQTLAWRTLSRAWPDRAETARRRNARLLDQYAMRSTDYGWETMRAAARAAHVLLGHLEAYANEGYLRTATQWSNVARLAAMVNHQPSPPTSALTTVGLIVNPTDDGSPVEIARGLAMKYTPPEGGPPVIFETLDRITAHSDLNTVRARGWNFDPTLLDQTGTDTWIDDEKADLSPGGLGVVTSSAGGVDAHLLISAARDAAAGTVAITLAGTMPEWSRGDVQLQIDPKAVRKGLPRSTPGVLVLKLDTASNYAIDSIIRLHYDDTTRQLQVIGNSDGHLKLAWGNEDQPQQGTVTVETLVPVAGGAGNTIVSPELRDEVYYLAAAGGIAATTGEPVPADDGDEDAIIGVLLAVTDAIGFLYTPTKGAKRENATVAAAPPPVIPGWDTPQSIVTFAGKPPKGLAIGEIMARRRVGEDEVQGLKIVGVAIGDDSYTLQFDQYMPDGAGFEPDAHEFHGPMTRVLRPFNWDRNPQPAFEDRIIDIEIPTAKALEQLRIGRRVLVEDEAGSVAPVLAFLAEAQFTRAGIKLVLEPAEGLAGFKRGWTALNLNAVRAGHGETKSPKVLGSGDGERALQSFAFPVREVSFVPSSIAETGVAPAMDVTVNGNLWSYRDLIDPAADGAEAWSSALAEDGTLVIHFRRRLPTGTDNVAVREYRVGVGPGGVAPARAFTKPMKKDRWVRAITQPLAATGGAGREPIEDIRVNAPARLAANGRAVSLKDFERLCRRRSDIWQALAYPITDPARHESVGIILVPANGGAIGPTLEAELVRFVESRSLPGIRVALEPFVQIRLIVEATVRVDVEAFDRNQVQAAAQAALIDTFSLRRRSLGQPAYIAEVAAALEDVEGVITATVKTFAIPDDSAVLRVALTGSAKSAYFPHPNQVISVDPASAGADMAVKVEAA